MLLATPARHLSLLLQPGRHGAVGGRLQTPEPLRLMATRVQQELLLGGLRIGRSGCRLITAGKPGSTHEKGLYRHQGFQRVQRPRCWTPNLRLSMGRLGSWAMRAVTVAASLGFAGVAWANSFSVIAVRIHALVGSEASVNRVFALAAADAEPRARRRSSATASRSTHSSCRCRGCPGTARRRSRVLMHGNHSRGKRCSC